MFCDYPLAPEDPRPVDELDGDNTVRFEPFDWDVLVAKEIVGDFSDDISRLIEESKDGRDKVFRGGA